MTPQISRNILWPLPFCSIRTQTQKTRSKFEKIRPPEWDTKKKSKSLLSLLSWQCQPSNLHYFPKLKKLNPPLSVLWMSLSFHALCDLAASPVLLSKAPSYPTSPSAGSALQKPPCAERTPVLLGEKPTLHLPSSPGFSIWSGVSQPQQGGLSPCCPIPKLWKNTIYSIQTILEKIQIEVLCYLPVMLLQCFLWFFSQSGNVGDGYKRQMCPAVMLAPLQQERESGQEWKRDRISEAKRACFQPLQDIFFIKSPTLTHSMNHMNTRLHLFLY